MNIESINIKNFKFLDSVNESIEGKNVYLIGGNGTGKTSFLDAIWCGLTGKNLPPEPIKKGNKKGLIEIDLGEFIARTKFTRGKPARFELENKSYEKESDRFIKSPRSYMESRVGMLDFSVSDFLNKSESEKLKYLAKVMDVDFSDLDADIEELMETRKYDKKKLTEIKANVDYYDEEKAKEEPVDVVAISKKLSSAKDKKNEYDRILEGVEARRVKIAELKAELERVENEVKDGEEWLGEEKNKPLTDTAMRELENTLENSTKINKEIDEAKKAARADEEADLYQDAIDEATREIEEKREEKAKRISENIKVPGLTYDPNEEVLLYEGLPFDSKQQNTASLIIAGMRIASTMLKDLKIIKVDASLIDKNNFEEILDWSSKENIELFVELVDREATKLSINVSDE